MERCHFKMHRMISVHKTYNLTFRRQQLFFLHYIKTCSEFEEGKDYKKAWRKVILCVCVACLSHLIASCEGVIHMMMIYSGPSVQWRGLNYYDNYDQNIQNVQPLLSLGPSLTTIKIFGNQNWRHKRVRETREWEVHLLL